MSPGWQKTAATKKAPPVRRKSYHKYTYFLEILNKTFPWTHMLTASEYFSPHIKRSISSRYLSFICSLSFFKTRRSMLERTFIQKNLKESLKRFIILIGNFVTREMLFNCENTGRKSCFHLFLLSDVQ